MIELPIKRVKANRINPKKIIIFGNPKTGKSSALNKLDNCLIIDVEDGTNFLNDALKINVLAIAKQESKEPIVVLKSVINKIKEANDDKGSFMYKYIAIDTVSALEEVVLPLAGKLYQNTAQGKNWTGVDITDLPNGAGYRFTRMALQMVLNELEDLCDTLIITAHVKDKLVQKDGTEMNERLIDLTGKMGGILASKVDAIGYIYREDQKTIVNFQSSDSLVCGGRCDHLINKKVTLIESDENNNITVDWSEIFLN
jgi:hypothetical protein